MGASHHAEQFPSQDAELEAALNVHKPRGAAGARVTMLHEAFTLSGATDDGGNNGSPATPLERLLPALNTLLGWHPPHQQHLLFVDLETRVIVQTPVLYIRGNPPPLWYVR